MHVLSFLVSNTPGRNDREPLALADTSVLSSVDLLPLFQFWKLGGSDLARRMLHTILLAAADR